MNRKDRFLPRIIVCCCLMVIGLQLCGCDQVQEEIEKSQEPTELVSNDGAEVIWEYKKSDHGRLSFIGANSQNVFLLGTLRDKEYEFKFELLALDGESGEKVWRAPLPKQAGVDFEFEPIYAAESIIGVNYHHRKPSSEYPKPGELSADEVFTMMMETATPNTHTTVFDSETGQSVWEKQFPLVVYQAIVTPQYIVAIGNEAVCAIDIEDGSLVWERDLPGGQMDINYSLRFDSGKILCKWVISEADGSSRGGFDCIDLAGGELLWREEFKDMISVALGGDYVFCSFLKEDTKVTSRPREVTVASFAAEDGSPQWETTLPFPKGLVVSEGRLIGFANQARHAYEEQKGFPAQGYIWSVDAASGKIVWKKDLPKDVYLTYSLKPGVEGDVAVFHTTRQESDYESREDGLIWLSLKSGEVLGSTRIVAKQPLLWKYHFALQGRRAYVAIEMTGVVALECKSFQSED